MGLIIHEISRVDWILKRLGRQIFVVATLTTFLLLPPLTCAQYPAWTLTEHPALPTDAKPRTIEFKVGCVDAVSGYPVNCEVNWESSFEPPTAPPEAVIDYTGGHVHPLPNGADPNRPIGVFCSDVDLEVGHCPTDPASLRGETPRRFRGMTLGKLWPAKKMAPQVSGKISALGIVTMPADRVCVDSPGWMCSPDRRNAITHVTFDITVPGLMELPAAPYYVRCGLTSGCLGDNVAPTHPKAFFGTGALVSTVQNLALAYYYHYQQGLILRLTDMSLPKGGLFDYKNTWARPHAWHRTGIDIDVSDSALNSRGQTIRVGQDELDTLACDIGLNRYEKPDLIHYRLEPCVGD